MELLNENELKIIDGFSELTDLSTLEKIEYKFTDKFLNDDIGLEYIGYLIKSIDNNLYCVYKKMLDDNIFSLSDNCKVLDSHNLSMINNGVVRSTKIFGPHIYSPFDLFVVAHEVGHALSNYKNIGNYRNLYNYSIYSETISILFGKLCELKYIRDFKIDNNVLSFEVSNINNALNCIEKTKKRLVTYNELFEKVKLIGEPKNNTQKEKFQSLKYKLEDVKRDIIKSIPYAFGLSFLNAYLNLKEENKELYIKMVTKYILTDIPFDYKLVLDMCDISFDSENINKNFVSYYEDIKTKVLSSRGK